MESPNVHLSVAELQLVQNAGVILTKNTIIKKMVALLETLQNDLRTETGNGVDSSPIFSLAPKISKGENYHGLPYVVLDYPRFHQHMDLCFIRSMFWWGHYFSSTLQVAGKYKTGLVQILLASSPALVSGNYFVGVSPDPWQHHFEETNYSKIQSLSPTDFETLLLKQEHIKIATHWPLAEWDKASINLYASWKFLAGLIA